MYRFSIVIPFTGNDQHLEETLLSILENRPSGCEVLVVHGAPYTDPYDLKGEVRFVQTHSEATLVEMARAGLAAACSEIIHILCCGVRVTPDWYAPVLDHFDDPAVGTVTPVVRISDGGSGRNLHGAGYRLGGRRLLCIGDSHRSKGIGPTLLAGFYRRSAVEGARGLDVEVGTQHADVDTALSLQTLGFRNVHEDGCLLESSSLPAVEGSSFRRGLYCERVFWRNAPIGSFSVLVSHCMTVMGTLLGNLFTGNVIAQAFGRIAGLFEWRRHRTRRDELLGRIRPKREGPQRGGTGVWRPDPAHPSGGGVPSQSVRVQ